MSNEFIKILNSIDILLDNKPQTLDECMKVNNKMNILFNNLTLCCDRSNMDEISTVKTLSEMIGNMNQYEIMELWCLNMKYKEVV